MAARAIANIQPFTARIDTAIGSSTSTSMSASISTSILSVCPPAGAVSMASTTMRGTTSTTSTDDYSDESDDYSEYSDDYIDYSD